MTASKSDKNLRAVQRLKVKTMINPNLPEDEKRIIDLVLKSLYHCTDKAGLDLQTEIYAPNKIKLNSRENNRLWSVMNSSGLISPVIGFGNSGKIELTNTGYQLMSQYGGYKEYLDSLDNGNQPQTIILPIQVEAETEDAAGNDTNEKEEAQKKSAGKDQ